DLAALGVHAHVPDLAAHDLVQADGRLALAEEGFSGRQLALDRRPSSQLREPIFLVHAPEPNDLLQSARASASRPLMSLTCPKIFLNAPRVGPWLRWQAMDGGMNERHDRRHDPRKRGDEAERDYAVAGDGRGAVHVARLGREVMARH